MSKNITLILIFTILFIAIIRYQNNVSYNLNNINSDSFQENNFIQQKESFEKDNSTIESNSNNSIKYAVENTTIRKMITDYRNNEILAEIKYNQKTLHIIGKIYEFGTDEAQNPYLILFGQSDWDNAKFTFSDTNDLITLNQYDLIEVECKIIGFSLESLSMNNCKLVEVIESNSNNLTKKFESSNLIISAYDIIEDYYNNQFYADNKYQNKEFLIQGEIKSIKRDFSGEPMIILKSGNYYWDGLNCIINEAEERILLFEIGDPILVHGIINGKEDNSIIIENCIIDEEWSNKKAERNDSEKLIGDIKLIGYLKEEKLLPYSNEEEWAEYCEDWDVRENCEVKNDWEHCSDLFNCNEFEIINNDFKDWHNVEILINDNYLVAFDAYNNVAPKFKFQPNLPILEKGNSLKFGSKIITCLFLDQNSEEDICDPSKNKIFIQNDMINYEKYNERLCNCETFSFAQIKEPIKNISVTANEGSISVNFN